MTRSNIPAANIPARMEVSEKDFRLKDITNATQEDGQGTAGAITRNGGDVAKAVAPLRKREKPQGSRDMRPRKRATKAHDPLIIDTQNPTHEKRSGLRLFQAIYLEDAPPLEPIRENVEISLHYTSVHGPWDRNSIVIYVVFAYACAREFY